MSQSAVLRRSLLFVPALRPDRFAKAVATGTDIVCVDWEDAVTLDRKAEARALGLPFFAERPARSVLRYLRINSPRTEEGLKDLLALAEAGALPDGVLVPKVATAEEIRWVDGILSPRRADIELMALIEIAEGVRNVVEIAKASPRLKGLAFGHVDLAVETGSDMSWETLLFARTRIVHAATEAGIDAMDGVWVAIDDLEGLAAEAHRVAALGFTGKSAIHPTQIGPIHDAFTPDTDAIERARRIVAAAEGNYTGAVKVDGEMVDEPVVRAARRTLAIAERI
jgi:citrate lyase beta subunit